MREATSSRINYIKQCRARVRAIYAFEITLAHCSMEALFRELIKLRQFQLVVHRHADEGCSRRRTEQLYGLVDGGKRLVNRAGTTWTRWTEGFDIDCH